MRDIVLYATDTMADWEFAYITTEITRAEQSRPGRFRLVLAGAAKGTVTTLGGLPLTATTTLAELDPEQVAVLVVPGADTYAEGHEPLLDAVRSLAAAGVPIAAICGGTLALARSGLLDDRAHTSNAPIFLASSGYAGAGHYDFAPVVSDRGVITATGLRPVEFSGAVFRAVGLYPDSLVDAWLALQESNEADDFFRLMDEYGAFANA
ncbi:DJ-1/PfpI family protein [Ammonicoccus fulvus]|uniref:DJ-1/PfpI family protein n=1 Tax=Ammonicoccus fulvus TaxID=3138240 RepID=A0ABZ3FLD1_9ACTN